MIQSFYTGNSGLNGNKQWLSVISDNIANVNTTGFKQERVIFDDLVSSSLTTFSTSGVPKNTEIGGGSFIGSTIKDFSQGAFKTTNQPLSLALDGEGFFMVKNPTADLIYYTRDGDFRVDANGDVITQNGYKLQGWKLDENGNMAGALGAINIANAIAPNETKNIIFEDPTNLDSRMDVVTKPFNPGDSTTYNYVNAFTVYDSLGNPHTASYYYQKVDSNTWRVYQLVDGSLNPVEWNGNKYRAVELVFDASGKISQASVSVYGSVSFSASTSVSETASTSGTFVISSSLLPGSLHIMKIGASDSTTVVQWYDSGIKNDKNEGEILDQNGNVIGTIHYSTNSTTISITDTKYLNNTATDNLVVQYSSSTGTSSSVIDDVKVTFSGYNPNTGASTPFTINTDFSKITQVASDFIFYSQQDGAAKGDLMAISVTEDGVIKATYTNGKVKDAARLAVATFKDKEILVRKGDNLYLPNQNTFTPIIVPGGVISKIRSGMLEMSNVDISQEFINLITAQRAYQANAKTITTSDQILQTTMDIKR